MEMTAKSPTTCVIGLDGLKCEILKNRKSNRDNTETLPLIGLISQQFSWPARE